MCEASAPRWKAVLSLFFRCEYLCFTQRMWCLWFWLTCHEKRCKWGRWQGLTCKVCPFICKVGWEKHKLISTKTNSHFCVSSYLALNEYVFFLICFKTFVQPWTLILFCSTSCNFLFQFPNCVLECEHVSLQDSKGWWIKTCASWQARACVHDLSTLHWTRVFLKSSVAVTLTFEQMLLFKK